MKGEFYQFKFSMRYNRFVILEFVILEFVALEIDIMSDVYFVEQITSGELSWSFYS